MGFSFTRNTLILLLWIIIGVFQVKAQVAHLPADEGNKLSFFFFFLFFFFGANLLLLLLYALISKPLFLFFGGIIYYCGFSFLSPIYDQWYWNSVSVWSNTMLGTRESDTEIEYHLLISVVWMHFLLLLLFIFFILPIILYSLDYACYEFLSTNQLWQCNVIPLCFFL